MSVRVMGRVWDASKMKGSLRLLTLAIADNANDDGAAYPGLPHLRKKILMSQRATRRLADKLVEWGEVVRKIGKGRGNLTFYVVLSGLNRSEIQAVLLKYAKELEIDPAGTEQMADAIIEKRGQFDLFSVQGEKKRQLQARKPSKKRSNRVVKGDITERKTAITVEPLSNTDIDTNVSISLPPPKGGVTSNRFSAKKLYAFSEERKLVRSKPVTVKEAKESAQQFQEKGVTVVKGAILNARADCAELKIWKPPREKMPLFDAIEEVCYLKGEGARVGAIINFLAEEHNLTHHEAERDPVLAGRVRKCIQWWRSTEKLSPPQNDHTFKPVWNRWTAEVEGQPDRSSVLYGLDVKR